jgi:hypothetical protein
MKRIALLTVLLLVVGLSLGFAQEFKPSIAWSTAGTATLTWGVDLDTMETGFTNAGSAQFTITLVPAVTLVKGADADVYGSITLTTTALTLTDVAGFASGATAVAAKIVAKPFEIGVNAGPTGALAKVGYVIEHADNSDDLFGIIDAADAALANAQYNTGVAGTYAKYVSDMITFQASIVSFGDWTRAEDTETNYAAGADATLVFKPITLGFGAWQGFVTGQTPIVYATVATDAIGPLTLGAQFDLDLGATTAYDLGAKVALALTAKTSLTAYVNYGDNFGGMDAKVVFTTTDVANLTETLTAYVLDLVPPVAGTNMRLVVDNTLSYKVALSDTTSVTPSLQVQYGQDAAADAHLKVVGAVSMALIPNTTIALTYTSSDFLVTGDVSGNTVTCAVTVAY